MMLIMQKDEEDPILSDHKPVAYMKDSLTPVPSLSPKCCGAYQTFLKIVREKEREMPREKMTVESEGEYFMCNIFM